jgi:preprotein translocase subunit SecB
MVKMLVSNPGEVNILYPYLREVNILYSLSHEVNILNIPYILGGQYNVLLSQEVNILYPYPRNVNQYFLFTPSGNYVD